MQSSRELNRVTKLAYKHMYDAMAAKPLRFRPAVAVVYESFWKTLFEERRVDFKKLKIGQRIFTNFYEFKKFLKIHEF